MGIVSAIALSLSPGNSLGATGCDEEEGAVDSVLSHDGGMASAVFLMTNQVPNEIAIFDQSHNGNLTARGRVPTGGNGNPIAEAGDPPTDPLGSQGSLVLNTEKRFLFAVNAGSNEISAFRVGQHGLVRTDLVPSGGIRPISLTVHGDFVYVLNEGGTPNIAGFTYNHSGQLTAVANSIRPLSGSTMPDPAEVSFTPRGDALIVTEKDANNIDTYMVGDDGLPTGPTVTASNGQTPFGFAFDACANLFVSEAMGAAPNAAAISSYHFTSNANLNVTSGSVPNNQTASCWVVISDRKHTAYTTNTGSGTISSFRIQSGGVLSLMNAVAADFGSNSSPIDMALEKTGRFLFVHAAGARAIKVLSVASDGSLTLVSTAEGLPMGAQGIAAR